MNIPNFRDTNLTEADLNFVIERAVPECRDRDNIRRAIQEDELFRKSLLRDTRIFEGVMADAEIFLKISPGLYFEILLRRALNDLEKASYTFEKVGAASVPVFDTKKVVDLLRQEMILRYLASMLASFIKSESFVRRVRIRKGVWRKIRFSDLDISDLIQLCERAEEKERFGLYKRIADVCVFIPGMFPEQTYFDYGSTNRLEGRFRFRARKHGIQEYEETGKKFYRLAAEHEVSKVLDLSEALLCLGENVALARKPLSFVSQHFLDNRKNQLFEAEN